MRPLLFLALLFSTAVHAQPAHPLQLDPATPLFTLPDSLARASAVIVLDQRQIKYADEGKETVLYRTVHRRIRVLDDRGVASFNTVTLPTSADRKIIALEARTITPSGRVLSLSPDDIKTQRSEKGAEQTLFALHGVEPGAEVEYLYTERRETSVFGQENYGLGIPVMEARFMLIAPERLEFLTKGYAGFSAATDSVREGLHYITAICRALPALEEEPYSNPGAHTARIGYKVESIDGTKGEVKRPFSWQALVQGLYPTYYTYSDRERSAVRRYVEDLRIGDGASKVEKIRAIEDDLKKAIAMSEDLEDTDDTRDLATILKKKVTTEKGLARLMVAALTTSGVSVELGLTTNRTDGLFDADFANWLTADEYVLYFPAQNAFLAPASINYRYPFVPYIFSGQQGVFCKPSSPSEAKAVIRYIPHPPADSNVHTTTATITFTGDDLTPRVELTNSFKGHNAAGLRELFLFTPKEKEAELFKEIIGLAEKGEDIDTYRVHGAAFAGYSTGTPLTLSATLAAPALMERAGPKYLFKVGEVIGRQVEMYNDEKRTLPIEMEYAHSLVRTIRVIPPAGYRIQNPDAIKAVILPMGSSPQAALGFTSSYSMEDGSLVIRIREFYNRTDFAMSEYAAFRQVINAAADWNKVVLVLVPEK